MFNRIILCFKNFDWILLAAVLLLVCFGLVEIYSVVLSQGTPDFLNFKKQIFFCILGFLLLFVFAFWDYYNLRTFSIFFYIISALLLVTVLFFGETIRGTRGWFIIGKFGLQPVEIIKFSVILFMARYFSDVSLKIKPAKHLVITGGGVFILIALILAQPDFGSALILFLLWLVMIMITGFRRKYFIIIMLLTAIVIIGTWAFLFQDYQKQRVVTFFYPSFDPLDQGYNVAQAIIAIGAGGFNGRGIGFGSQSQLKFLPESQNDFIFAVIAEELGFLGVSLILLFFFIFFYRCLISLKKINNNFAIYFVLGTTALIFIEMFINIGMNTGLLPVIGISLPFVSYGGSAMIVNLILVGVVESIIIRSKISY